MRSPLLDRPARGSSLLGRTVLGSVNWAFVVTLLALLVFIFMWFTVADERDKAKADLAVNVAANDKLLREGNALVNELDATALLVGFLKDEKMRFGDASARLVNREQAVQHLSQTGEVDFKDGETTTKVPGLLNVLRNHLKVSMLQAVRSASGVPAENARAIEFTWMTQGFKSKLKEAKALLEAIPPHPVEPADKDDAEKTAKYRADLAAYEAAVSAYNSVMDQLHGDEFKKEWKPFSEMIAGMPFDPDTSKAVEISFAPKITGGRGEVSTLQELMLYFHQPFQAILADYKANKEEDVKIINTVRADLKAANDELANQATRYADLVASSTSEQQKKNAELEAERTKASKNESDARAAENALAVMQKETKAAAAKLNAELAATRSRIESDKEQRDLEIRRDEVDGTLLAVSNASETGTIDLGSSSKVYPGLKFVVSYVDRGGARQSIGEVQVIKVTGPSSSQVRVLSAAQPLVSGHLISNPLFNASRAIHIYPLGWSPDLVQQRRLDEMGVVVDARPSAATDYFVVPDDWKGGGAAAPKEGEDPAAAIATNPLDKAKQDALNFGATVITRRMLDTFLKL